MGSPPPRPGAGDKDTSLTSPDSAQTAASPAANGEHDRAELESRRLAALVRSSEDAIILKAVDGTILEWNPAAERMYGWSAMEAVGRNIAMLLPPERKDEVRDIVARILRGERVEHFETVRLRKDGTRIDVALTLSALRGAEGEVIGISTFAWDITELKQARGAESERRNNAVYRELFERVPIGLFRTSAEGRIIDGNPALARLLGYGSFAELRLQSAKPFYVDPADRDRWLPPASEPGVVHEAEFRIRRRDGSIGWVHGTARAVVGPDGTFSHYEGSAEDITARKRAEEEATRHSESLSQAQRIAHLGSWDWDLVRDNAKWSDEMFRIFGLDPAESGGDLAKALSLMHPEDREKVALAVRQATDGSRPYDIEYRIVRPDGDIRRLHARGEVFRDALGRPIRMIGTVHDVTAIRDAQEGLQRVNRALRVLSAGNTSLLKSTSEQEIIERVCRAVVEVGGYRLAWVGKAQDDAERSVQPLAHAGHESGYIEKLRITWSDDERGRGPVGTAIRTGKPVVVRDLARDPSMAPWRNEATRRGYASVAAFPLHDGERISGCLAIYSGEPDAFDWRESELLAELSEDLAFGLRALRVRLKREEAEAARLRSVAAFQTLVEAAPDAIISVDREGKVRLVNAQAERMFGYSRGELIGGSVERLIPARFREVHERHREGYMAAPGTRPMGEGLALVARRKDGSEFPVEVSLSGTENGEGLFVTSFIRDITARREAERTLEEAQQFREALIDVVSHEFRTPVTVIQGYAELLASGSLSENIPAMEQARARIARSAKHLGFLLTSMLELSRLRGGGRAADLKKLQTIDLFTEAVSAMDARGPGPSRAVSVEVQPGAEELTADQRMLLIVLVELLDNAAKYSPPDGPIVLRAETMDGQVLIEVEDRGQGIPENIRKDVFKPFVQADSSSVRKTGGAGLGLSVAQGLVKAQGGRIELDSQVGKGTTVRIVLPRPGPA